MDFSRSRLVAPFGPKLRAWLAPHRPRGNVRRPMPYPNDPETHPTQEDDHAPLLPPSPPPPPGALPPCAENHLRFAEDEPLLPP